MNTLFFGSHDTFAALQAKLSACVDCDTETSEALLTPKVIGDLAVIPVAGIIAKRVPSGIQGVCDLDVLNANIAKLPFLGVTKCLFWFDTDGGQVQGLFDTWERINALSNFGITTIAYSDTSMLSAGYVLASACDVVVAADDASVGMVGVRLVVVKTTTNDKQEGIDYHVFSYGANKDRQYPHTEWRKEIDDPYFESLVKEVGDRAWSYVTRKRTLAEEVKQADIYSGEKALAVGLVESVQRIDPL